MVQAALILARGLSLTLLPGLFGLALFAKDRRWLLVAVAAVALPVSILGFLLLALAMTGGDPGALTGDLLVTLLRDTAPGLAFLLRIALLAALLVTLVARRTVPRWVMAFFAGGATATLAWNGHGAMDAGAIGWVHLGADIVHMLAAGAWIGALIVFVGLAFRRQPDRAEATRALAGFAGVGSAIVAAILATGLVNAAMLIGVQGIARLPDSLYGRLMIAKLMLFGVMLMLASANRFVLTPGLVGSGERGLRHLRISLSLELAAALAIVGLVAWAGISEPPVSA
ncbi:copper homeostasis membrane protein CopD [Sphingomonas sp. GM_Shp_1]|uniref:copper homeostasis membrane protein CopD n=1 Tax=Sphingomonas sp. GM_Shp_1 TaxID=2937381 RepID=UPI00226B25CF|nr:copper homeostasis membrane protein CopD [Sphingomonas sp. GM_Shp_1]